jgi:WD40 repeat protein
VRVPSEFLVAVTLSIGSIAVAQQRPPKLELINTLEVGGGPVHSLAFSRDGKWLATGGLRGDVLLWDVATRTVKRRFVAWGPKVIGFGRADTDLIGAVAFSPEIGRAHV